MKNKKNNRSRVMGIGFNVNTIFDRKSMFAL